MSETATIERHDWTPPSLLPRRPRIIKAAAKSPEDHARDHEIAILRYYAEKHRVRLIFPIDTAPGLP